MKPTVAGKYGKSKIFYHSKPSMVSEGKKERTGAA
jgi:hypothetical protein